MPLSNPQVEQVAHLARLNLTPEETQKFTTELAVILEYIDQLNTVETAGMATDGGGIARFCPLRDDVVQPSLEARTVLALAPNHDEQFILVPKVIG